MKTALITGATHGIGRAISEALASEGYALFIVSRHADELIPLADTLSTAAKVPVTPVALDVSDYQASARAFEQVHIDVLINNAGCACISLLQDMTEADWDRVIDTNLKSVFNLTHAVLPGMIRRQNGVIINISSIWGVQGASMEVAYSASKGGVNAFTKALAREAAPSGIRVNAVACGIIDTRMNQHLDPDEKTALAGKIGLGRFGNPGEVADLVRYLISDQASYLTGQVITLDGAMI